MANTPYNTVTAECNQDTGAWRFIITRMKFSKRDQDYREDKVLYRSDYEPSWSHKDAIREGQLYEIDHYAPA